MTSSVFFRFKSQKEPSRVTFDGTGISVFELKRDIIAQNKLGDGTDFELILSSEDSNEVYDDDTSIIPRSTTVIAKRLPASKPGRGGAARYVSGKMPQNAKNSHRQEAGTTKSTGTASADSITAMHGAQTEEEKIAAMFRMGADDWAQQQQHMANAAPIHRAGSVKGKPQNLPGHPPPSGYVCYRCGEKGHWIMECPTNNDPTFDGRPRIKRTTGIPKSFLKTIEKPTAIVNDGTVDDTKQTSGVMVNAEGEWVVAEPDQAAWDKYQAQTKVSAAAQNAASQSNKDLQERGLECSVDKRLFVDPSKTPCCHTTYCHECIQNVLLDNDLRCPQCSSENISIDDLISDEEMAVKVRQYEEEVAAAKLQKTKEEPNSPSKRSEPAKSPSQSPVNKSSVAKTAPPGNGTLKKRSAESELENDRRPTAPRITKQGATPVDSIKDGDQRSKSEDSEQPPPPSKNSISTNVNPSAYNNAAFPAMGGFMGMNMGMGTGMPMSMAMQNPMMMPTAPFMGNGWGMGQQQNMNMGGGILGPGALYNGAFNQQHFQGVSTNNFNNMNSLGANHMAVNGQFANQQRSSNEEESAYFRKPVNPNRQYNRRNWTQNRLADYREI